MSIPKVPPHQYITKTKKHDGSNQPSSWNTPGSITTDLDYPWPNQSSEWNGNIQRVHLITGLEYPRALSTSLTYQPALSSYLECSRALSMSLACHSTLSSYLECSRVFLATTRSSTTSTQHNMSTYTKHINI